jgi:RNA polymerase sigma factor (sigma-70 family)
MPNDSSVTQWLYALDSPSPGEAQQQLWDRYFTKLVAIARNRLAAAPRRANDEEDVALCVMQSFFQGVSAGRFPQLRDRGDLWRVLVTITARKALNQLRDNRALKRGGARVRGESIWQAADGAEDLRGIEQVIGNEPTPQFAVQIAEQCQLLLDPLSEELRVIAQLKLEGCTTHEIAERLGSSPRTIERRLEAIRRSWENHAAQSL